MMNTATVLDPDNIRDIAPEALDAQGRLRLLPASYWATTTREERALFGHRNGLYSFPTVELVEHLRALIAGRSAIEIGAGHGVLAEALGIPATDSMQQAKPKYAAIYALTAQPTVPYGPNVVEMHASRAVRHYKPEVVIGCWVTHKYNPQLHDLGGNEAGIDEFDVLDRCAAYVLIGNEIAHAKKPLWAAAHSIQYPSFVYSRSFNGSRDFIAVWKGGRA